MTENRVSEHRIYTPYCGLQYDETTNQPFMAESAPHLLISAPTRTGKTRRILSPAAVIHPGPYVGVSSKPDLAQLVMSRRYMGPVGVIDLRPTKAVVWPANVRQLVTDPTRSIETGDDALTVAETMLATSGVGFGGAASGQTVAAGGLWETSAAAPLACLLYAASPKGNNLGMPWVLRAVASRGDDEESETHVGEVEYPSWTNAFALCPYSDLREPLMELVAMDSRLRDSVTITMKKAITPWVRLGLANNRDTTANGPQIVEHMSIDSFDMSMLEDPNASLFVIAPNSGTVAGAAVALIDSIIQHFRKKSDTDQLTHRLLLELDEVCNSCPLPSLLNYVGESAGLGVNIMATVQASEHFEVVFGASTAQALRKMFPGTLIMYGSHEKYILEEGSDWLGLATRRTEAYEPHGGSRGQSSVFGPQIDWQDFLPQNREEAHILARGGPGTRVHIPDWTDFLTIWDRVVQQRASRAVRGKTNPR
ncbi:type IV secretory system conjugative DNA transfer family protein [Mycolicibacterium lutetiense]|uniref:Type IV secretion system protein VirD4 n=1 Tax=Mycolicibacterium lutetiense TaxID=1641992 RepID=A0ABS5A488_9MYCO|nr:TraM recognition domain-containing protein [Mycolicibacterium lutetiense]MBP2456211.1 type IV secretion system protein VirD4 [Mycolicibacterium lutetiense]